MKFQNIFTEFSSFGGVIVKSLLKKGLLIILSKILLVINNLADMIVRDEGKMNVYQRALPYC